MAKFEVSIGDEFHVVGFEIEDVGAVERLAAIDARRRAAKQQAIIKYVVLATFVVALAVATLMGWADGTYDEVGAVMGGGGLVAVGRYLKKG